MKKYTYTFNNGETETVEVSDELFNELTKMDRKFENLERKERYHQVPLNASKYEGKEFMVPSAEDVFFKQEEARELYKNLDNLTDKQRDRLEKFADDKTISEIAKEENASFNSVKENIGAGIEKIKKNLKTF